ncbi:MAG: SdrD B-like domain-containing protein, partial [Chloroflexota bacterium]
FAFTNNAPIRFIVREGLPAGDYNDGSGFRDYQNCIDGEATSLDQNGNSQNETGQDCANLRTSDDPQGFANITLNKQSNPQEVSVTDTIQFTLTVNLTEEASGNLIDPVIQDELPAGLNFVSWDSVSISNTVGGDVLNAPYLVLEDDVNIGGEIRDRLQFYWDDVDVPTGTLLDCTGACNPNGLASPAGARELDIIPPVTGNKTITITFTAEVLLSAAAGNYSNALEIAADSPNLFCQSGTAANDTDDLDDDGLGSDVLCFIEDDYDVREAADMSSQKWIRSVDGVNGTFDFVSFNNLDSPDNPSCPQFFYDTTGDGTDERFTRFPCVAEGLPEGNFEYLLRVINTGVVNTDEYIQYDILPFIGDTGVSQGLSGSARETEFLVFMTGPVEIEQLPTSPAPSGATFTPPTFTIEYSNVSNACRTEMENTETAPFPAGCVNNWTIDPVADFGGWDQVRSFRIVQNNSASDGGTGVIPPGTELYFSVPMEINQYGDAPDLAETGEIAWNSFAQRFSNAESGTRLLPAEPPKVGIVVEQRFSIGNRVWIDDGFNGTGYTLANANNGQIDVGELPRDGVEVQLWRDIGDGNGFQLFATDETRDGGYYIFANLDANTYSSPTAAPRPIDYQVRIPATEFQAGGPLEDYISSFGRRSATGNNNVDSEDNGIDPTGTTVSGGGFVPSETYETDGVRSTTFQLTANQEATGETDVLTDNTNPDPDPPSNEGPLGRGEDFEDDPDSDLTVDFGFFRPMSIGNIVWLDDDNTVGTPGDGIINGAEAGIPDVVLRLYLADGTTLYDVNPNQGGIQPYEVTTDANGFYLFDLLPPGEYVVRVEASNFAFGATNAGDGPLADYISSLPENPVDENVAGNADDSTDHGIDPATDGDQRANGVSSAVITLTPDSEITTEALGPAGDGRRVTPDNSDLTVDFGFWEEQTTFSLGNRVWDDINNNGILDPGETGINGVQVALYEDDNGDGVADSATPLLTT